MSPWLSRRCPGAAGSQGCRHTTVVGGCSDTVVSDVLVPTPLESDMMSLVSPALLSATLDTLTRLVRSHSPCLVSALPYAFLLLFRQLVNQSHFFVNISYIFNINKWLSCFYVSIFI